MSTEHRNLVAKREASTPAEMKRSIAQATYLESLSLKSCKGIKFMPLGRT
jgi:hypothetical protein